MDLDADADLDAPVDTALRALADLGTYPHWLAIVGRAEPAPAEPDGAPAWIVDLVGKVGPFTRTKTVRMVRTRHDPSGEVRFERREHDGRHHNAWVLTGTARSTATATATATGAAPRTHVHVRLHYGGGRSLPGADLLLRQEARKAGARLQAFLDEAGR